METAEILEAIGDMFLFRTTNQMSRRLEIYYGILGWLLIGVIIWSILKNKEQNILVDIFIYISIASVIPMVIMAYYSFRPKK